MGICLTCKPTLLKNAGTFCLLDRKKEVRDEEYKFCQEAKQLNACHSDRKSQTRDMKIQTQSDRGNESVSTRTPMGAGLCHMTVFKVVLY